MINYTSKLLIPCRSKLKNNLRNNKRWLRNNVSSKKKNKGSRKRKRKRKKRRSVSARKRKLRRNLNLNRILKRIKAGLFLTRIADRSLTGNRLKIKVKCRLDNFHQGKCLKIVARCQIDKECTRDNGHKEAAKANI